MSSTVRSRHYSHYYKTSIGKLLYVRLREGYTIRDVDHFVRDGKDMIKIFLTLSWKPGISIEYVLSAPWRKNFQKMWDLILNWLLFKFFSNKIYVELFVEGSADASRDFFGSEETDPLQKTVDRLAFQLTLTTYLVFSLVQVDNLLVHMHMFNLHPANYKIPRDLAQKVPFFELRNGKVFVTDKFTRAKYNEFAQFWYPVCVINEALWQKWVHMNTLRVVLVEDVPLPKRIFTKSNSTNEFDQVQCREAGRQVLELLARRSTFVLLKDQCFVNILFT